MQCPKCQFKQDDNHLVCSSCGIVFAKYHKYHSDNGEARVFSTPANIQSNAAYRPTGNRSAVLKRLNSLIFYASCIILIISFFKRDEFPQNLNLEEPILEEPLQNAVEEAPFEISQNDVAYQIQPLYEYELEGLVVSYRHHDGNYGLHRLWNDHLNVADVCIVWGDNAHSLDLNAFEFWNGSFTCNLETSSDEAWKQFNQNQLSNNHLLIDDEEIRAGIEQIRIGDKIRIKGVLASYKNNKGFNRGTSITRKDRGNGACETIFVDDFKIIDSMDNVWRSFWSLSVVGLFSSVIIWLIGVIRGDF